MISKKRSQQKVTFCLTESIPWGLAQPTLRYFRQKLQQEEIKHPRHKMQYMTVAPGYVSYSKVEQSSGKGEPAEFLKDIVPRILGNSD